MHKWKISNKLIFFRLIFFLLEYDIIDISEGIDINNTNTPRVWYLPLFVLFK